MKNFLTRSGVLVVSVITLAGMGFAGVGTVSAIAATCTPIPNASPVDGGAVPVVNAAVVATSGQKITGTIDATGCGVGVYVGPGVTGVTVKADVSNAHYVGIYVDGGNAKINGSSVTNVGDTPFDGVQYGWGIGFVTTASGSIPASGEVTNTKVSKYQKGGIVIWGVGSSATLSNDTVTGLGPINFIAQNGVEFVYGNGSVSDSKISGFSYQGGTSSCPDENYFGAGCAQSAGILLYDAPANTTVTGNKVSASDMGISLYDDSSVSTTTPYLVSDNTLTKDYGYGIVFDGVYATSTNNSLNGNPVGILVTDSSANAMVASLNDGFSNNVVNSEALEASPGSTLFANIIVEAKQPSSHFPFPFPKFPHFPGF